MTGKSRAQRAADLAALSAARSMRDDFDRLFVPAPLAGRLARTRPTSTRPSTSTRAAAAGAEAARPQRGRRGAAADRVPRPRTRSRRCGCAPRSRAELDTPGRAAARCRSPRTPRRRRCRRGRRRRRRAARRWRPAAATPGRSSTARARAMRPDVAAAFDRMAAAARADGVALLINDGFRSDAEQAVLWAAEPRPALGRAARHVAAPLRHRARPRPAGGLRLAGRERPALRLRPALLVGGLALRLRRRARRRARPRATRSARAVRGAARAPDGRRRRGEPAVVRAGAVPRRDRRRGAALERLRRRCSPRS